MVVVQIYSLTVRWTGGQGKRTGKKKGGEGGQSRKNPCEGGTGKRSEGDLDVPEKHPFLIRKKLSYGPKGESSEGGGDFGGGGWGYQRRRK